MTTIVPASYDEAIEALVALDIAKWGEAERQAATHMHRKANPTYGRALNTLVHSPEYDYGDTAPAVLIAAAKAAWTDADRAWERQIERDN